MDDNDGCLAWVTACGTLVCALATAVAAVASCIAASHSYQSITDERQRYAEEQRRAATPIVRIANEYAELPIVPNQTDPFISWKLAEEGHTGLRLHNYGKGNAHGCELHWQVYDRKTLQHLGSLVTFPKTKNSLATGEEVVVYDLPTAVLSTEATEGTIEIKCTNDSGAVTTQNFSFHTWMETTEEGSELRIHCFPTPLPSLYGFVLSQHYTSQITAP